MMSRNLKAIALVMFALLCVCARPCPAQTVPQAQGNTARGTGDKFDAPAHNELDIFQSEWAFRQNALHKVMPEFPEEALKAGAQGVVVLSLYQDGEGRAANIKVVESPHPAITKAAIAAVEQWRWRKFAARGLPRPVLSKLSFKFIIQDGAGLVEDPPDDQALRNMSELHALRLKATWPDEKVRPVNQGNPD